MGRVVVAGLCFVGMASSAASQGPSYVREVRPILAKHCFECHNAKTAKGGLDLESYAKLTAGGDSGPALVAGDPKASRLVSLVDGSAMPTMPPRKVTTRPTPAEIATLAAWVKAGAKDDSASAPLALPKVAVKHSAAAPVAAVVHLPGPDVWLASKRLTLERSDGLRWALPAQGGPLATLGDTGHVAVALGRPGEPGRLATLDARKPASPHSDTPLSHDDAILAAAASARGNRLATAGYDTRIRLGTWEATKEGVAVRAGPTLKDHSDAVYALAFDPAGARLASCAADRTVKIWDASDGRLLGTLSEATDWLLAVAWSPEGTRIASGGVDKSLRVYAVGPNGAKLARSAFAHEGSVLALAFSADGKTLFSLGQDRVVKAWDPDTLAEQRVFPRLADDGLCLAVHAREPLATVGGFGGALFRFDLRAAPPKREATSPISFQDAKPKAPKLASATPNAVVRGQTTRVRLVGTDLTEAAFALPGATVTVIEASATGPLVEVTLPASAKLGAVALSAKNAAGAAETSLFVDAYAAAPAPAGALDSRARAPKVTTPATLVGALTRSGEVDHYRFDAKAGQPLGVHLVAVSAKFEPALTLLSADGQTLASAERAFLGHTFAQAGTYVLAIRDRELRGGSEFGYRLHLGEIPVVASAFPLGGRRGTTVDIRLRGVFLERDVVSVKIPADAPLGSVVPTPVTSRFGDPLGAPSLAVGDFPEVTLPTEILVPGVGNGTVERGPETWTFAAKKGERLAIETVARRLGSPLDSTIEVLGPDGQPLTIAALRSVAKTYVTFRDHDSVQGNIRLEHWNGLAVDDLLYVGTELMKIKNLPAHPDADCMFFAARGQRLGYLGTSTRHHSNGTPMYKVSLHPPGTTFPPNGFPTFALTARNDDGGPGFGRDSRLFFDPPADGKYQVRVSDARGASGPEFGYRLVVRKPTPDFAPSLAVASQAPRGAAVVASVTLDRIDGFEGPVSLRFENLPPGLSAPATVLGPDDTTTAVALFADAEAKPTTGKFQLVAEATIHGVKATRTFEAPLPQPTADAGDLRTTTSADAVTLPAGGEAALVVRIERKNGFAGRVPLEVRGLPHGMKVLDIGLNGILVTERETSRRIVLHAEPWVLPGAYPIVVLAKREGKNTEHVAKAVLVNVAP